MKKILLKSENINNQSTHKQIEKFGSLTLHKCPYAQMRGCIVHNIGYQKAFPSCCHVANIWLVHVSLM